MRIAYLNYGAQSGVTANLIRALEGSAHEVVSVDPTDVFALRDPANRLPRLSPQVAFALVASAIHYRRNALQRRWNTPYAFDGHSRRAGELLCSLRPSPDVVLQA